MFNYSQRFKSNVAGFTTVLILIVGLECNGAQAGESANKKTPPTNNPVSQAAAPAGQVVFPLKYTSWVEGEREGVNSIDSTQFVKSPCTSFTLGLKLTAPQVIYPVVPCLKDSPLTAVECDETGKALTLYIDLNTNGKLDEGERISADATKDTRNTKRIFSTPDFEIHRDGKTFSYRLGATQWVASDKRPQFDWKVLCAQEGVAMLEGQERRLTIFDTRAGEGNYTAYHQCCVILDKVTSTEKNHPYQILSSLIRVDNQYYDAHFSEDKKNFILTPNLLPQGSLQLSVVSVPHLKTKTSAIGLSGGENNAIALNLLNEQGKPIDLPAMTYRFDCALTYWSDTVGTD
ncbi:TPA: hypothetical protein DDW35_03290 [Candidatus Sumerlaeota bacterium]|jgi:hypothetical protein|nr:hypothetical protein [Candidatus Sumerlaeota bacterium]